MSSYPQSRTSDDLLSSTPIPIPTPDFRTAQPPTTPWQQRVHDDGNPAHRYSQTQTQRHTRRGTGTGTGAPTMTNPAPTTTEATTPSSPAAVTEEFSKIKHYEDFSTIDWVQDAVYEHARRRARARRARAGTGTDADIATAELGSNHDEDTYDDVTRPLTTRTSRDLRRQGWSASWDAFWSRPSAFGWRQKLYESYDAGQAWLVVTLVGAAIGLNSAILNIITEWLSDIKMGRCRTAWYLNEQFCCWGEDIQNTPGSCADWQPWTSYRFANYVTYALWATLLSFCAAVLVDTFEPYAAGSGISEIKVIVAGFVMRGFLGLRTLAIKSLALPLAIGSGLSVGKEGPSVHFAVCTGNVISRLFSKYRAHKGKMREILTASSAAGVAVAFGSPIGGVLFALEEVASYFPLKTLWRSYFSALVAVFVLALVNPFRTGQLVMFQVKYDRTWHLFELCFFAVLGVFGGLYGAFTIKWNLRATAFRKRYLSRHPVAEATVLAGLTAVVCYPNMFLRINMTEMMEVLFAECEKEVAGFNGICEAKRRWATVASLFLATLIRTLLVIVSYGCKVPAGIFVPSMAIGASLGRMVGILAQSLHEAFPDSSFFSSCQQRPDVPCITPGTYAFLGAGAALSGIMHLTVSVTVIMFELTGATTYILPTMIVVGVTKVVSDVLEPGQGGIADRMIKVNGLPFLDNKEEHVFGVPVSRAMTSRVVSIPDEGMTVGELRELLERDGEGEGERAGDADAAAAHYKERQYQGWPIVAEGKAKVVVGWIGRMELEYAIEKAKTRHGRLHGDHLQDLPVRFVPREEGSDGATDVTGALDFSAYVDRAPISVHPGLALETVIEMFKKIGPRVILIVWQGRLCGLVTMKDVLRFQYTVEEEESEEQRQASGAGAGDEEGWVERYAVKLLRFTKAAYGVLRSFWPWRREESRRPSHAGYQHVREYTDDAERGSQELDSLVEGQSQGQDSQSRRQSTSQSQSRGQG